MLFKEINQKFTEKVSEYLGNGYTINTATMSGSQGEVAKVDVTDGKEIYRIMLDRFSKFGEDHRHYEGYIVLVGRCGDEDVRPNDSRESATIWNGRLEIIESECFFEIGFDSKFYGTKEEAEVAYDKCSERYENRELCSWDRKEEDITSEKTVAIVEPYLKKQRNVSRVNRNEISVKRYTQGRTGKKFYRIYYYSDSYELG